MKTVGITEFKNDMNKVVNKMKKNEEISVLKNNKVVGVFIKK